jgi:hypothetical protein
LALLRLPEFHPEAARTRSADDLSPRELNTLINASHAAGGGLAKGTPTTGMNLVNHGGPVMRGQVVHVYVGDTFWHGTEGQRQLAQLEPAFKAIVEDAQLSSVAAQYGSGAGTTVQSSYIVPGLNPTKLTDKQVQSLIANEVKAGRIQVGPHLPELYVALHQAPGIIISDGTTESTQQMNGYHSHVDLPQQRVYYGQDVGADAKNGFQITGDPVKDREATFFHELNEFRTDGNVPDQLTYYDDVTPLVRSDGTPVLQHGQPLVGLGEIGDGAIDVSGLQGLPIGVVVAPFTTQSGLTVMCQKLWSNADKQFEIVAKSIGGVQGLGSSPATGAAAGVPLRQGGAVLLGGSGPARAPNRLGSRLRRTLLPAAGRLARSLLRSSRHRRSARLASLWPPNLFGALRARGQRAARPEADVQHRVELDSIGGHTGLPMEEVEHPDPRD